MQGKSWLVGVVVVVAWAFGSCSVTRQLPEGVYFLRRNVVVEDKATPKKERVKSAEIVPYLKQSPNKRLLGTNFYAWVYMIPDSSSKTWISRGLRKLGETPVLMDTTMVKQSNDNIQTYLESRGYFNNQTEIKIDSAHKKATVTYRIVQNTPYRVAALKYDFKDKVIESVIVQDSASTLLRSGMVFDVGVLDKERLRIATYLKEKGYYNFSINNIGYVADSTRGNNSVDLTLVVKQYLSGYDAQGLPVYENSSIFRIKNINILPNYNATTATTDPAYKLRLDTLTYKGLNIVYDTRLNVREPILQRNVGLYPNYLYNSQDVNRAYSSIMRLGFYRSASILFREEADSTAGDNSVTFIDFGGDGREQAQSTTERYLNCDILCTPAKRQSYSIEVEASSTTNFNAIATTVGYQNRNLFRGVELLDISLRAGYEFMKVHSMSRSVELGGTASLSFSRFLIPFRVNSVNVYNPRTKVELSLNNQKRPYYNRTVSRVNWGYSWSDKKYQSFQLRPIDVSVIRMRNVDQDFIDQIDNDYLRNSYKEQMMAGFSGSFLYSTQKQNSNSDYQMLRVNAETSGNLIGAVTSLTSTKREGEDFYRIFNMPYSQYFRIDATYSQRFMVGTKSSVVYRVWGGGGLAYGNSTSLPFDRLFYSGGSNSMRGWVARTLGPGNSPPTTAGKLPMQLGDFKLETNVEARFPVWKMVEGALFVDVGNVWYLKQSSSYPSEGVFRLDRFYEQLGLNTGLGMRLNVNFFVVRLDWGVKIHNPNNPQGERWRELSKLLNFSNTTLNFGLGYPF